ncbi:hypothetical protein B0A61_08630 [Flavobacterium aquatile LMG 4008 = ATCC 11947]|nr:hypothetical protein B0A61_08630 [Flavobacterium aquatile LMG 4008 = ATCC 11947]
MGLSAQEKLSKEEKERREKNIQAGNPFKQFGYKGKVATLSKGKYLEVHDLDSIVTIGSVRFHVDRKEIVGSVEPDVLSDEYSRPIGDIASRWLSPDPKSEEFADWSPYNMCFDNPMKFVDPDGQAPVDWFKNQQGRVVWFDNTSKGFTDTNGGKWTNVGANLNQVKTSLNVPTGSQNTSWTTVSGTAFDGENGAGKAGFALAPVIFNNNAQVTYDFSLKNTDSGGGLISGKTEISGINVDARVSTSTFAPGTQIEGVSGFFGIKEWTPSGFNFTSKSSPFQDFKGQMLSNAPFHATSDATMNVSLSTYKNLTNTSSGVSTGLNLSFKTYANTVNQQTGDEEQFKTGN